MRIPRIALFSFLLFLLGVVEAQPGAYYQQALHTDYVYDQIDFLKKELKANGKSPEALTLRGKCYSEIWKGSKALEDFDAAIQMNPKYYEAYFRRGREYYYADQDEKAIKDLEFARDHLEGELEEEGWSLLIDLYDSKEQRTEVLKLGNRYLKKYKSQWSLLRNMGHAYYFLDSLDQSMAMYDRALQSNPEKEWVAEIYRFKADILSKQGNIDMAIEEAQTSLSLDPDEVQIYQLLGSLLYEKGDYQEAIPIYHKVAKMEDKECHLYYSALCYYKLGEWDKAMSDVKRVLNCNSENTSALLLQFKVYHKQGRLKDGFDDSWKLTNVYSDDTTISHVIWEIYHNEGWDAFKNGFKSHGDGDANYFVKKVGQAMMRLSRFNEAAVLYDEYLKSYYKDIYVRLALGYAHFKAGNKEKAVGIFDEILGEKEHIGALIGKLIIADSDNDQKQVVQLSQNINGLSKDIFTDKSDRLEFYAMEFVPADEERITQLLYP